MKLRTGLIVCLIGMCSSGTAWAAADPAQIVEAYLKGLVAGDASAAFDTLMTHSRVDELKPREIQLVKGQIAQGFSIYGAPSGYERVSRTPYTSSLIRFVYVTKHADTPLVWNFHFYRATNEWQLLNFDFNDLLDKLE